MTTQKQPGIEALYEQVRSKVLDAAGQAPATLEPLDASALCLQIDKLMAAGNGSRALALARSTEWPLMKLAAHGLGLELKLSKVPAETSLEAHATQVLLDFWATLVPEHDRQWNDALRVAQLGQALGLAPAAALAQRLAASRQAEVAAAPLVAARMAAHVRWSGKPPRPLAWAVRVTELGSKPAGVRTLLQARGLSRADATALLSAARVRPTRVAGGLTDANAQALVAALAAAGTRAQVMAELS